MDKVKSFLLDGMIKYKLIIFSVMLIFSYTYIIRNDYVAADAYIEPSEDFVPVTCENPAETEITASGKKINSILLGIQNPESLAEGITTVGLYDEGEMLASAELSNNNYYEASDPLGNAVELSWGGGNS